MPVSPLVIGVDSSTTSTKAIIVDETGSVLAQGKAEFELHTPRVDFYEQDPRDWWLSTNSAIARAVAALSVDDQARITHICATIQRQTFALVDEDGEPLRPGIIWLDGRAADQVRRFGTEAVHQLTGFQPDVTPSVYKIAWLADNEPEVLRRADKLVGVHAYLVHAMTGRWVDSQAAADSLGLFDMANLTWSDLMLGHAGLDRAQLPELVPAASVIDVVKREVSQGWGLDQPVSLVASCGDGQAAALGVGAIGPDEAYLNMGTALVARVHGATMNTPTSSAPTRRASWSVCARIVQNSGRLPGWLVQKLGDPVLRDADPALEEASAQWPSVAGWSPCLLECRAIHWNPVAHGAVVGLAGSYGGQAVPLGLEASASRWPGTWQAWRATGCRYLLPQSVVRDSATMARNGEPWEFR